ncbi:MAG: serine/threonine protein kinase [Elusimicrobia bacterium]|nr:serine/threonine protein kinase [Elusimicrobiota bacterium]
MTLGQGGQGSVIQVKEKGSDGNKLYALKVLAGGKSQKVYERFVREVDAIQRVQNPYIIRIVDHSAFDASFHYYVMEFVEGVRSLKKLIGSPENFYKGNVQPSLVLFLQLCQAIRTCEEVGIVHRDISPANVLILPDQTIKVVDFGLCQLEDHQTITLTDEAVGTPNYMAPECESGGEGTIGTTADLYSAGKILWSAIANMNAFARESPAFTTKSMPALFPDRPGTWHLHHVFEKTIRRNSGDRWQTAKDAITVAGGIKYLISSGYPPLELIAKSNCPLCGFGVLKTFDDSHCVFGNPNPSGIVSLQCNYCGYCYAINSRAVKERLSQRQQLT